MVCSRAHQKNCGYEYNHQENNHRSATEGNRVSRLRPEDGRSRFHCDRVRARDSALAVVAHLNRLPSLPPSRDEYDDEYDDEDEAPRRVSAGDSWTSKNEKKEIFESVPGGRDRA